ncbi:hypothetical protein HK097_001430 [Rhizophlyctis rosea]|uniref:HhH-GPD domain-containing protein n=1 Tax=Rhizophlyctis rosea TaxID=64517 RepID=A0AAD5SCC9_9FUNG|nr:hypothetical protein HK097_001430 [Rhizophlyctis rosea]
MLPQVTASARMLTRRQARLLAGHIDATPGPFKITKPIRRQPAKKSTPPSPTAVHLIIGDNAFHPSDSPATPGLSTAAAAVAAPAAGISTAYVPLDYATALKHVTTGDPKLAEVIASTGKECRIFDGEGYGRGGGGLDAFRALATAIVYQQLSGKAAAAILRKFLALFGSTDTQSEDDSADSTISPFPSPESVKATSQSILMGAGLSTRKAEYLHALSDRFIDGSVSTRKLLQMSDDDIRTTLVAIKGIGPWTVDMFLMFDLKRANILPVGDLGIQKGMSMHFNMKGTGKKGGKKVASKGGVGGGLYLPTPDEMREAAKIWEPYRTIGSYYMWAVADVKTLDR